MCFVGGKCPNCCLLHPQQSGVVVVEGTGLGHLPLLMCAGGAWHPCCCPTAAAVGSRGILRLTKGLSNLSIRKVPGVGARSGLPACFNAWQSQESCGF